VGRGDVHLYSRAKSELYNPLAMYRFAKAVAESLTIDSQLGGIEGLCDLVMRVRSIPSSKILFFTLPTSRRGSAAQYKQPEDREIFADLRADLPRTRSFTGGEVTARLARATAEHLTGLLAFWWPASPAGLAGRLAVRPRA